MINGDTEEQERKIVLRSAAPGSARAVKHVGLLVHVNTQDTVFIYPIPIIRVDYTHWRRVYLKSHSS